MLIFIPSLGRADRQITLQYIPKELRRCTVLVVPKAEVREYAHYTPADFRIVGCPAKGIGPTRQWIVDHAADKHILMLDDDLRFYRRKSKKDVKLVGCTEHDMVQLFKTVEGYLTVGGYAHIGIAARTESAFHQGKVTREAARVNNFHGFNVNVLKKHKLKFSDDVELMEDFHMTLRLLKLGYPNIVNYYYAWNQDTSNARGGCSTYRNAKMQEEAARKLAKLHPDVVQLVVKKSKSAWKGMQERVDVKIQWRKAYPKPAKEVFA